MTPGALEAGYWRAYRDFYRWGAIARRHENHPAEAAPHSAYAAGWKKFEPMWDLVIRARRVAHMRPVLEAVLGAGRPDPGAQRIDRETHSTSDMSLRVVSP